MTEFVTQQVPRARRVSLVHQILTLQIPEKDMVSIPGLFVGLDEKRANGEISSYNVATNSLEDVFLKYDPFRFPFCETRWCLWALKKHRTLTALAQNLLIKPVKYSDVAN